MPAGRKKTRNEDSWNENIKKSLRNEVSLLDYKFFFKVTIVVKINNMTKCKLFTVDLQGKEYISCSNEVVPAKVFTPVESCCNKEGCREVDEAAQENFFKEFWENGYYDIQNNILKGLMT